VPTADEQILPHGTGYITDVGMCGIREGVLGIATETILQRFLTRMPERHQPADGEVRAQGAIFTLDEGSGRITAVERVTF
jgi:calcineurin-like phosphoesterase